MHMYGGRNLSYKPSQQNQGMNTNAKKWEKICEDT
jgi:hypothetical protein